MNNHLSVFARSGQNCKQICRTLHRCTKIQLHSYTSVSQQPLLQIGKTNFTFGKCQVLVRRFQSSRSEAEATRRKKTTTLYFCATGIFMLGMAYAGVPLYRIFCTVSAVLCFKLNYSKKNDVFKCL